jgi:ABC-type polysaccharide/polyol phosphate transport system ATPase subunit
MDLLFPARAVPPAPSSPAAAETAWPAASDGAAHRPSSAHRDMQPVRVEHVSKSFKLPHLQIHTLKERAMHPFAARTYDMLHAVDDVSLTIQPGEFFGIVGRNGSGKSTLLKCLAGIYQIDSGRIEVNGRIAPFIELGVGFNPELTARDNAIINAIMLGLTRKEAAARFDDIIAFAELEGFLDLRLKNYSSGMNVRLAFSVAVQVDADILLIDEVLAVGDASFQAKCFDEFERLKREGRTIVFVTHDMGSVERFCDRAMLMDRGRVVDIGDPVSIARQYNEVNFARARQEARESGGGEVLPSDPAAQVTAAVFESPAGEVILSCNQGDRVVVRVELGFLRELTDPIFAIGLRNERHQTVFATSTAVEGTATGSFEPGDSVVVRFAFENWLAPGRYLLDASVSRSGANAGLLHRKSDSSLFVAAVAAGGGDVDLPHTIEITRD